MPIWISLCYLCILSICYLVVYHFGFEEGTVVLVVLVPGHFLPFT